MRTVMLRSALHLGVISLSLQAISLVRADDSPIRWHSDYNTARKEAEEKGCPLVVEIGSPTCVHCRRQDATTFRDPAVIALLTRKFVAVRIDGNKEQTFVQQLKVQMYPTTIVAAPDGKILSFLGGYVSAEQFQEHARKALPAAPDKGIAKDLYAAAREEFQAGRYADCLDKCDRLMVDYADARESTEAIVLAKSIRNDPERLAVACEQLTERTATLYLTLADSWTAKGEPRAAQTCLEKVLALCPRGRLFEQAEQKLRSLRRTDSPTSMVGFEKK